MHSTVKKVWSFVRKQFTALDKQFHSEFSPLSECKTKQKKTPPPPNNNKTLYKTKSL